MSDPSSSAGPGEPAPPGGTATVGRPKRSEVVFVAGLPGFPEVSRCRREPIAGCAPFERLVAEPDGTPAFVVVPPGPLFPDYRVEVDDDMQLLLGVAHEADAEVLLIVTVPPPPALPSANLLGPLVVNRRDGRVAQVVQVRSDYPTQAPLLA